MIATCASHVDSRQAIFRRETDGSFTPYFSDHRHMFGGPEGGKRRHFVASRCLDKRIYQKIHASFEVERARIAQAIDSDRLSQMVGQLPSESVNTLAIAQVSACIAPLPDARLLKAVYEAITDEGTGASQTGQSLASLFGEKRSGPHTDVSPRLRSQRTPEALSFY
jgi:hypothetical protein